MSTHACRLLSVDGCHIYIYTVVCITEGKFQFDVFCCNCEFSQSWGSSWTKKNVLRPNHSPPPHPTAPPAACCASSASSTCLINSCGCMLAALPYLPSAALKSQWLCSEVSHEVVEDQKSSPGLFLRLAIITPSWDLQSYIYIYFSFRRAHFAQRVPF